MFRFIIKDSWVVPSHVSLLFVGDFEQVYVHCVKSAARHYFAVLVCSSFFWRQNYSVLALNIVDSPILVFVPIASGQCEQALLNLSSFDQSTVSLSLRKLVKPKKSENQRDIHEVLFESLFPNLATFWLCLFAQNKINSIYIDTYRRHHLPGHICFQIFLFIFFIYNFPFL